MRHHRGMTESENCRVARVMLRRHGQDARAHVILAAIEMLRIGDFSGCAMWRRIFDMISILQAKAPAEGEAVH